MTVTIGHRETLARALWPTGALARNVVLAVLGSALLWASAKVQVPFWPVPMTMQTFVVLVIGAAYGARLGAATIALYLAQGAAGLPVFAAGGGIAYFAGPTAGYLFGFVVAAALVGWLAERGWDRSVGTTLIAMLLGTLVIFTMGAGWLSVFLAGVKNLDAGAAMAAAWSAGVVTFLPAEAFKIALAATLLPLIWKRVTQDD